MTILNFADRETERVWSGEYSRVLPSDIQRTARRKLRQLDNAAMLTDLTIPAGNRFERLKGDMKGRYSIRINDQWRITFAWIDGGADDVRIEDYH
jgi:proteic killer suppression protein